MGTPVDDALDEAGRELMRILGPISLTREEKQFAQKVAFDLTEWWVDKYGSTPAYHQLRPMAAAWALAHILGPWDAWERLLADPVTPKVSVEAPAQDR